MIYHSCIFIPLNLFITLWISNITQCFICVIFLHVPYIQEYVKSSRAVNSFRHCFIFCFNESITTDEYLYNVCWTRNSGQSSSYIILLHNNIIYTTYVRNSAYLFHSSPACRVWYPSRLLTIFRRYGVLNSE